MAEDVRPHTLEEALALKKRLVDERETDYPKRWNLLVLQFDQVAEFLRYPYHQTSDQCGSSGATRAALGH